jgi:tetratricopeptide (TPR) repeat protein
MCYWGLGKAEAFYHSNSPDYAKPAFEKASSLIERVSDRERLYIRATMADSRSAVDVWRTLVQRYPDDAEAQLFLAQASGGPEYLATLQSILKVDPNNSAANHAYIHAREGSAHPEEALRSAEVLATLAPASGHMVHMPGHIYFRLGDYARAEQAFAASERVDERYLREQHVDPDNDWNYVHNLMYAIANFLEEGKFQAAITSSMKLNGARGVLESTLYVYSTRDSMSRLEPRLPVALRTANWQQVLDLLNASRVPDDRPHLALLAAQLRSFATGMKAIEGRDVRAASEASASLDAALRNAQPNRPTVAQMPTTPITPPKMAVRPDALLPPILSVLSIMASELRGGADLRSGLKGRAGPRLSRAPDLHSARRRVVRGGTRRCRRFRGRAAGVPAGNRPATPFGFWTVRDGSVRREDRRHQSGGRGLSSVSRRMERCR